MSDDIYGVADREDLEKYASLLIKRNISHIKKTRLDRLKKGTKTPINTENYFTIEFFTDDQGLERFTFCKCDPDDPIYDFTKPVVKEKHFDAVKAFRAFNMSSNPDDEEEEEEQKPSPKKSKKVVKIESDSEQEEKEVVEKPKSRKRRSLDSDDE